MVSYKLFLQNQRKMHLDNFLRSFLFIKILFIVYVLNHNLTLNVSGLAVYISYNKDLTGHTEPIPFDEVHVDVDFRYHPSTSTIYIHETVIYMIR